MTDASSSEESIPIDLKACIQCLVAIARQSDPAVLAQEEHRAHVMEEIQAFRQWGQETIAPHARPTRVACKCCYFRMRRQPPVWRAYCILGLAHRQCRAIAFASGTTLWDDAEARIQVL